MLYKMLAVVDAGGLKCRYSIFIVEKCLLTVVENIVFIC